MKTQLIQDFNESGSVPGAPAAPPSPAVAAREPATEPSPEPATQPATEPATEPATQPRPAVWHRPQQARGFAQHQPGLDGAHGDTTVPDLAAPLHARPPPKPRDTTDVNGDPEWLAALLARDAAELSESQSSSRWTRRLASWGTATVLLVLLAAGGLWLYQESRVEGALVVVANTSPAPVAAAARPSFTGSSPALPASSGMATAGAPALPATPVAAPSASATPAPLPTLTAERQDVGPSNAEADKQVQEAEAVPAPRPKRSHVRKHPKAETTAGISAGGEPSAHQRREETLMQCRAHGYAERQCLERGCEMTRFGFACKG